MKLLLRAMGWPLAAVVLIWPALYNGQPFFYPDTTAYIRGADTAVEKAMGRKTPWTQDAPLPGNGAQRVFSRVKGKVVMKGRSIYYGALLYVGEVSGGFWVTILAQAGCLIIAMALALRAMDIPTDARFALLVATVGLVTPAALFASYLMPDLFAGIAILACAVLLASPNLKAPHRLVWFALLAAALCFHVSHVLIAAALLVTGIAIQVIRPVRGRWSGIGTIVTALLVAIAAEASFDLAVERFVGAPPLRPPFLTARVIEDGPGYRYLKATCPENGFKVCQYLDRLPTPVATFLWSLDPASGVFAAADPQSKRALSAEEPQLTLAVLAWDPLGQAAASARNVLRQLGLVSVPEFRYDPWMRERLQIKMPVHHLERMRNTPAGRGAMPVDELSWLSRASFFAALGFVIWRLGARRKTRDARIVGLVGLILLGVLVNAAVCGALSVPLPRFQARLAWLLPFCALLIDFSSRASWWDAILARGSLRTSRPSRQFASEPPDDRSVRAGAASGERRPIVP